MILGSATTFSFYLHARGSQPGGALLLGGVDIHQQLEVVRRRGATLVSVLVAVLVLGIFALALFVWSQQRTVALRGDTTSQATKPPASPTTRTEHVSPGISGAHVRGLPIMARKPTPVSHGYQDCPAEGDGGDRQQNRLKNRVDSAAWLATDFDDVLSLPWPPGVDRRQRDHWTRGDRSAVAKYEGLPLSIEGYFAGAKQEGPEASNCHGADADFRDWHIWIASEPGRDRARSIVVETTPSVRAIHPEWTLSAIRRLARDSTRVRVSGWLFLDPEHPDQDGRTRGTIWEIHPVMRIEAWKNGQWEEMR